MPGFVGGEIVTVEISMLMSGLSVAFAVYFGIVNHKRTGKRDARQDATEMTTVIVKLENIGTGIAEIKAELSDIKNDVKENRERIIRLETKQEN